MPFSPTPYNPQPGAGYKPGNQFDKTPFDAAQQSFNTASQYAIPSAASRDTAAARIRSRIEGKQAADSANINQQYAGRGISTSGLREGAQQKNTADYAGQYGTALAENEDLFNQRQQQGSQILGQIGQGQTQVGTGQNASANLFNELGLNSYLGQGNLDNGFGNLMLGGYNADNKAASDRINSLGQYGGVLSLFAQQAAKNPNSSLRGIFDNFFGGGTPGDYGTDFFPLTSDFTNAANGNNILTNSPPPPSSTGGNHPRGGGGGASTVTGPNAATIDGLLNSGLSSDDIMNYLNNRG